MNKKSSIPFILIIGLSVALAIFFLAFPKKSKITIDPVLELPPITHSKEKKFTYEYTQDDLADAEELSKLPVLPTPQGSVRIPILLYHHISDAKQGSYYVSPAIFRQQMAWLYDNNYKVIPLEDALDHIQFGLFCEKCAVITFDDGDSDQYSNAVPILQEFGYTATFFIVPEWTEKTDYMNKNQVKALSQANFTIGSHAWSHRDMQTASSEERKEELTSSKKLLEDLLGKEIGLFAYPGGAFNSAAIQSVQEAGYKYAIATKKTIDHTSDDFFSIGRMHIDNDLPYFIARIEGRYHK